MTTTQAQIRTVLNMNADLKNTLMNAIAIAKMIGNTDQDVLADSFNGYEAQEIEMLLKELMNSYMTGNSRDDSYTTCFK